ncbi:MAG: hypothetical protein Q7U86_07800 [Draconibacterium sp.]|nr:hypothetical protein [Draconibacterium sp.]
MDLMFDLDHWERVKWKLKRLYPQLTDSDLIWRHESKENLFTLIATKLVISKKAFTEIVESL